MMVTCLDEIAISFFTDNSFDKKTPIVLNNDPENRKKLLEDKMSIAFLKSHLLALRELKRQLYGKIKRSFREKN